MLLFANTNTFKRFFVPNLVPPLGTIFKNPNKHYLFCFLNEMQKDKKSFLGKLINE
jgi:hypothetical protein